MKHLLINQQTGEETLCDKITIDGFEYYVIDKKPNPKEWFINLKSKALGQHNGAEILLFKDDKKVIATNNPNIDVPKVVDEVERLFWKILNSETPQSRDELLLEATKHGFKFGYNKSQETHPFSEEDMIEFAKYKLNLISTKKEDYFLYMLPTDSTRWLTTKELLQLWKSQQPKKVYYNLLFNTK